MGMMLGPIGVLRMSQKSLTEFVFNPNLIVEFIQVFWEQLIHVQSYQLLILYRKCISEKIKLITVRQNDGH